MGTGGEKAIRQPRSSVPSLALMEYAEIVFEVWLATKRNAPPESITSDVGFNPAGVRGRTSVSSPVLLFTENNEMSFPP